MTNLLLDNGLLTRTDLESTLAHSHIEPANLSTFQRILLTTDGTVTDILEAYAFEQIKIIKLSEQMSVLDQDIIAMNLKQGTEVISRKVLLQGKISRKTFIYAESILVPDRLDEQFRKALLETKTPIGKVWLEQRVETFKEILETSRESAEGLSSYFGIEPTDKLLSRTYQVISGNQPAMMITEKFPEHYFLNRI
jgi:chorismate-pyruvate lyase